MKYVKVRWNHDFDDDPVVYLSELDEDECETRKVQFYRDGSGEWSDGFRETPTVGLAEIPFPPLKEIDDQDDFSAELISAEEFEDAWIRVRANS